jgi:hypothetical protein
MKMRKRSQGRRRALNLHRRAFIFIICDSQIIASNWSNIAIFSHNTTIYSIFQVSYPHLVDKCPQNRNISAPAVQNNNESGVTTMFENEQNKNQNNGKNSQNKNNQNKNQNKKEQNKKNENNQ